MNKNHNWYWQQHSYIYFIFISRYSQVRFTIRFEFRHMLWQSDFFTKLILSFCLKGAQVKQINFTILSRWFCFSPSYNKSDPSLQMSKESPDKAIYEIIKINVSKAKLFHCFKSINDI